jgi:hypothetical protein
MNAAQRLLYEYRALGRILSPQDFLSLLFRSTTHGSEILRTKRLTALDLAMSRDLAIRYRGKKIVVPLKQIDQRLAGRNDNPTFGNIREMYARDCYLSNLRVSDPVGNVLDLGANRGLFGLLALTALRAERVVEVEPLDHYREIASLLCQSNELKPDAVVRYSRFVASPSAERKDPAAMVSIQTIVREQKIDRLGLVKIDVEGAEADLFSEPEWLAHVDRIAMEVHPHFAEDLTAIPIALEKYGFHFLCADQWGNACPIDQAMFLFASRVREEISSSPAE